MDSQAPDLNWAHGERIKDAGLFGSGLGEGPLACIQTDYNTNKEGLV